MAQVVSTLATIALLAGLALLITRLSAQAARSVWLGAFVLVVAGGITMMVAHAFVTRWGIRVDSERDGLPSLIAGTAHRPFVYRRLTFEIVGAVASFVSRHAPAQVQLRLVDPAVAELLPGTSIPLATQRVQVYVAYLFTWLALFASVPALAAWLRSIRDCSWLEALLASCLGMALVPLTLIHGAYIYDSMELLLWTLALLSVTLGRLWALPLVFALLALNKESALTLVPLLFPLLLRQSSRKSALLLSALIAVIAGSWLIFVRHHYAGALGAAQEWSLRENLKFWTSPQAYLGISPLFSPVLLAPRSGNVVVLLLLLLPARFGWRHLRSDVRAAGMISVAIMLPLFIVSGATDETRVLGPVFPFLLAVCSEGVVRLFGLGGERPAVT